MHNIWFHFQKARMTFSRQNTRSEFGDVENGFLLSRLALWRDRIETGFILLPQINQHDYKENIGSMKNLFFIICCPNPQGGSLTLTVPLHFWWPTRCHQHMDETSQQPNQRQTQTVETPLQRLNRLPYQLHTVFSVSYKHALLKWLPCQCFPHTPSSVAFRFLQI